jgi:hypothetical protein
MKTPLIHQGASKTGRTATPGLVQTVLGSPGAPLDRDARAYWEPRFGHDLGRVRVHTDVSAAASAAAVQARAYTVGQHIVFGAGAYKPGSAAGRQLLAHELTHTLQQRGAPAWGLSDELHVGDPADTTEQDADRVAADVTRMPDGRTARPVEERAACSSAPLMRQALPVEAEPPAYELPEGEAANDNTETGSENVPGAPRYATPSRYDQSYEAVMARAEIASYRRRVLLSQEQPVATLARGGDASQNFITEHGTQRYAWIGGPGGGGSGQVRVRHFHVLDAIEYAVGRANTEDDLQRIVEEYVPLVGLSNRVLDRRRLRPAPVPPLRPMIDEPIFRPDFDPGAVARLQTLEAAVQRRVEQVPALARSRFVPRSRRRGRCQLQPTEPLGDDPLSGIYCHAVTGSPFSYRITVGQEGGSGLTQRWAEIDALRGNTWFECKCGYENLLTDWRAPGVLEKLDRQVLNHKDIATTCGLEYRYIVSNERVRQILQSRWFGNVVIDVRQWEPCGPT